MISLGRAKRFQMEIEAVARELNRQIADAASEGLIVEAKIFERQLVGDGPVPFLDLTVKVKPDLIEG